MAHRLPRARVKHAKWVNAGNCSPSRGREGHFFLVLGAAMLVWSSSMGLAPLTRYGVARHSTPVQQRR